MKQSKNETVFKCNYTNNYTTDNTYGVSGIKVLQNSAQQRGAVK